MNKRLLRLLLPLFLIFSVSISATNEIVTPSWNNSTKRPLGSSSINLTGSSDFISIFPGPIRDPRERR